MSALPGPPGASLSRAGRRLEDDSGERKNVVVVVVTGVTVPGTTFAVGRRSGEVGKTVDVAEDNERGGVDGGAHGGVYERRCIERSLSRGGSDGSSATTRRWGSAMGRPFHRPCCS